MSGVAKKSCERRARCAAGSGRKEGGSEPATARRRARAPPVWLSCALPGGRASVEKTPGRQGRRGLWLTFLNINGISCWVSTTFLFRRSSLSTSFVPSASISARSWKCGPSGNGLTHRMTTFFLRMRQAADATLKSHLQRIRKCATELTRTEPREPPRW